jgi:hypothetical protein
VEVVGGDVVVVVVVDVGGGLAIVTDTDAVPDELSNVWSPE